MEGPAEVNETFESSVDAPHIKKTENDQPPEQPSPNNAAETHAPLVSQDAEWAEHFTWLQTPEMFLERMAGGSLNCDPHAHSGPEPHSSDAHSLSNQGEMVEELTLNNYKNPNLSLGSSTSSGEKTSVRMGLWQNFTRHAGKSRDTATRKSLSMGHNDDVDNRFLPPSGTQRPSLATQSEPKDSRFPEHVSKIDKHIIPSTTTTKSPAAIRTKVLSASGFQQYLVKTTLKGKGVVYNHQENRDEPGVVISRQNIEKPNANLNVTFKSSHSPSCKVDSISFKHLGTSNPYSEGITLREWLKPKRHKINKAERMHIFEQILDFVDICHSQLLVLQYLRPSYFIKYPSNQVKYIGSFVPQSQMELPDLVMQDIHHLDHQSKRKRCTDQDKETHEVTVLKLQKFRDHNSDSNEHHTYPFTGGSVGDDRGEEKEADSFRAGTTGSAFRAVKLEKWHKGHNENCSPGISSSISQQSISELVKLEEKCYTSPEEINDYMCSSASNIYSLGVFLFELLCCFETWEVQSAAMLDLQHRILPRTFLSESPKEAGFCLWLLHPDPSSRPMSRDIIQSDLLSERRNFPSLDNSSALIEEEDAEADLLLHFLLSLKEQKKMQASKLEAQLSYLKADIEEAERRLISKTQLFSDDRGFRSKFIESSSTYYSEKSVGNAGAISTLSKSNKYEERLMRNIDQLESAYFSRCSRIGTPEFIAAMRSDYDVLKIRDRCSQLLNDADEATDHLGTFFDGLCKFAQYSKFEVCGSLKNLDIVNSANVICSLSFDRDEDYFAAAGVSKKIKIFEFGALLNESVDVHYPLIEMTSGSKLSCVCWNDYIKNYLASTDYEGIVQLWDASTGQGFTKFAEHKRRAWSVNFSVLDPTMLASGSDDCTVKIWSINEKGSIDTIRNVANVCCVQLSHSSHLLAFGSADYKIYCYDLRNTRIPWCTLSGHGKAISYVKFLDSETIVSASTDNTLKLWDLKRTNPSGLSTNACSLTLSGHTNEKNFVGLSVCDGYILCGSETNEVYAYYKTFPMPMTSHKFGSIDPNTGQETSDDDGQFVSSVCWRGKSDMVIAANSTGRIKVLQLV
ncbi:protein SUPPRESSOR OF PHYA-105 1-like isoform X2 [Musa acuminata AAA Group]|uniref:protein SUPPRESSOR OF PHYA-105 1-like isoform X2 n=1 Tax=Musa acuminata AAA Group TaxID=214697 RepID=UPI0031CE2AF3